MVVRSRSGDVRVFPAVQTQHRDSILSVTEAPANVPAALLTQAQQLAAQTVSCLEGMPLLGVSVLACRYLLTTALQLRPAWAWVPWEDLLCRVTLPPGLPVG